MDDFCNALSEKVNSSFISSNNDMLCFGTFRVPIRFHLQFGKEVGAKEVKIRCYRGGSVWEAEYSEDEKKLYDLNLFMKYYRIKIHHSVLFDYIGNGRFLVKIFKPTAVEIDYPLTDLQEWKENYSREDYQEAEFLFGKNLLEMDKSHSQFMGCGFGKEIDEYGVNIYHFHLHEKSDRLLLDDDLKNLYKHWKNGDTVTFWLKDRRFDFTISWTLDYCAIDSGWRNFVIGAEVKDGDRIVFENRSYDYHELNVYIIASDDRVIETEVNDGSAKDISFYHIMHRSRVMNGQIVVPKVFHRYYNYLLKKVHVIHVNSVAWSTTYHDWSGVFLNMEKMMEKYDVQEMYTIFFTIAADYTMSCRIYDRVGVEVEYELFESGAAYTDMKCMKRRALLNVSDHWVFKSEWKDITEIEEEALEFSTDRAEEFAEDSSAEDGAEFPEFEETCGSGHIQNRTHGMYICTSLEPITRMWQNYKKVELVTDEGVFELTVVDSGRRKRFSGGWNRFVKENRFKHGDVLTFRLVQMEPPVFNVDVDRS